MKEAYVTFETAKLLKENGFDWDCLGFFKYYKSSPHAKPRLEMNISIYPSVRENSVASCPTQQMACRWLREEKGIHIMPTIGCDVDRTPRIFYSAVIALFNDYGDIDYRDPLDENGYNEPEDAIEAALKYCLTNLI